MEREAALLDPADREELVARVAERSFGLGPLEPLLRDSEVDEIMVNGTAPVWVEHGGRLERTEASFATEAELRHAIERILAPLGRRVDEAEPLSGARLPDRNLIARDSRFGMAWVCVPASGSASPDVNRTGRLTSAVKA